VTESGTIGRLSLPIHVQNEFTIYEPYIEGLIRHPGTDRKDITANILGQCGDWQDEPLLCRSSSRETFSSPFIFVAYIFQQICVG
jgi:hypothetical protein